jgi:hypothetical protein
MKFNLRGLLQDEEFLLGAGLLTAGSQGQNVGQAVFPSMIQAAQIKKAFAPTAKKTKQAYDNVLQKNVFVTDLEVAQSPERFTPIDTSQSISFNPDTGKFNIFSGTGKKRMEILKVNNINIANQLKGSYDFLSKFIPDMQSRASETKSGAVGGTIAFLDSFRDQLTQITETTGLKKTLKLKSTNEIDKFLDSQGLKKEASNYAQLKGSVTKLGYVLAKIEEPENPRLSEGDILRQLARINFGGSRNQFIASLQGILNDEFISAGSKFKTLNPDGKWDFKKPNKKNIINGSGLTIDDDPLGLL